MHPAIPLRCQISAPRSLTSEGSLALQYGALTPDFKIDLLSLNTNKQKTEQKTNKKQKNKQNKTPNNGEAQKIVEINIY